MYPVIPHRTLVGIEDRPLEEIRPGAVIACGGGSLPPLLRVIVREEDPLSLLCLGEYKGKRFRVGEAEYRGVAIWRSWRGSRRSLETGRPGAADRIYINLARAEHRFAFLAPLRRWMSLRMGRSSRERGMEKEISYLVQSLRSSLSHDRQPHPGPPEGVDWDVLLELALGHAVQGVLTPRWNSLPPKDAPLLRTRRILADEEKGTARSWEEGLQILQALLPALGAAGIPCLVLKGPSLAESYGDRARQRCFGDLDLLVRPRDLEKALDCLEELGFMSTAEGSAKALLLKGHFHLVLKPPPPWRLPVELHWQMVDRGNFYRIDLDRVFSRAGSMTLQGISLPVLSPEDEGVYLCLHLCKHGILNRIALDGKGGVEWLVHPLSGNRLIWFVDLLFCFERKDAGLSPSLLWERARSWNVEEKVLECLLLLGCLFPSREVDRYVEAAPLLPSSAISRGRRETSFWLGGRRRRRFLRWSLTPDPLFTVRPVRLFELWELFFPDGARLSLYYRDEKRSRRIWRRFTHPFHMAARLFR